MICAVILIILQSGARAQSVHINAASIDLPCDPASLSTGESYVARRGILSGIDYNPATLAGIQGSEFEYSLRNLDYDPILTDQLVSLRGAFAAPFGTVSVLYSRLQGTELPFSGALSHVPPGTITPSDKTYGIGYSTNLGAGWDIGFMVKIFDSGLEFHNADTKYLGLDRAETPGLFDIGLLYTMNEPLLNSPTTQDHISIGASYQNFGEEFSTFRVAPDSAGYRARLFPDEQLPLNFRLGFSYAFSMRRSATDVASFLDVNVTGSYRGVFNLPGDQFERRNYWGFGIEATFYECLIIRGGSYISSTTGIYGKEATPAPRYGGGLRIPFNRMGISSHFAVQIDVALMPVHGTPADYGLGGLNSQLLAYSLALHVDPVVFRNH